MRGSSIIPPSGDFYRHQEEALKPRPLTTAVIWLVLTAMSWNLIALIAGAVIGP